MPFEVMPELKIPRLPAFTCAGGKCNRAASSDEQKNGRPCRPGDEVLLEPMCPPSMVSIRFFVSGGVLDRWLALPCSVGTNDAARTESRKCGIFAETIFSGFSDAFRPERLPKYFLLKLCIVGQMLVATAKMVLAELAGGRVLPRAMRRWSGHVAWSALLALGRRTLVMPAARARCHR